VRRGHNVVVLDDLSSGKVENLSAANGKVELLRHSVTDLDHMHERAAEWTMSYIWCTDLCAPIRPQSSRNQPRHVDGH